MTSTFPEIFAIVRDTIRPPCLQMLVSYVINHDRDRNYNDSPLYEIDNMPHAEYVQGLVSQTRDLMRGNVNTIRCQHPDTRERIEVNWWFTPFYVRSEGLQRIPILEFQTRSWIPVGYAPIPIQANINEMLNVLGRIQEDRLAMIRAREDAASQRYVNHYRDDYHQPRRYDDIRTPPALPFLQRNLRRSISPVPSPPVRVVEVEVPVERVVVQNRALPLPKSVGTLLIKDARSGSDSCPIAATPFAECEKLSVSSCFHIFDAKSLARWQADHTSCPVCRCKIENVVSEESLDAV
jgi:hypothetical protein